MKRGPVPNVPRSSGQVTKVEVEIGPPGLKDGFILGAIEDLSIDSTDHHPGHSLRLVLVPLGSSWNQEGQDN